ncbi:MAG: hypothetical protein V7L31_08890 [Nostoc sp.]
MTLLRPYRYVNGSSSWGNPFGASLSLWEKTGLTYQKAKGNALANRNSP